MQVQLQWKSKKEGRLFSIVGAISLDSGALFFRNSGSDLGVLSTFFFLVVQVLLMEVHNYWNIGTNGGAISG
jgi:hypothetical protein